MSTITPQNNKVAVVDFENVLAFWQTTQHQKDISVWIEKLAREYLEVILVAKRNKPKTITFPHNTVFVTIKPIYGEMRFASHSQKSYDDCYCVYLVNLLMQKGKIVSLITKDKLRGLDNQSKDAPITKVFINGRKHIFDPSVVSKWMVQNAMSVLRDWQHDFEFSIDAMTYHGSYHNGTWYPPQTQW